MTLHKQHPLDLVKNLSGIGAFEIQQRITEALNGEDELFPDESPFIDENETVKESFTGLYDRDGHPVHDSSLGF